MSGRTYSTFRSGNLSEHLGVLLLKGLAAVAEVSRPEDIGLDAIATLLRLDEDRNYYAEDVFVVQLKSASEKKIKYTGHELAWLKGQNEAMFIGLSSLKKSSIRLFSTIHILQAIMTQQPKEVTAYFSPPPADWRHIFPWEATRSDNVTVYLGEPVISWKLSDISSKKWKSSAYGIMKAFLNAVRLERYQLKLGQSSKLTWSTNNTCSPDLHFQMLMPQPAPVSEHAQHCLPLLLAMLSKASILKCEAGMKLNDSIVSLILSMQSYGIDVGHAAIIVHAFNQMRNSNNQPVNS